MNTIQFVSTILATSVAGTCMAHIDCIPEQISQQNAHKNTSKQPNIILINIDDLGWADLGYNGSLYYETPNIDHLHHLGISFQNAYAGASNSAPSRACMLTGLYTPRHGVYTVNPTERGKASDRKLIPCSNNRAVSESFVLLPQALKNAGYQTCHIGKWHVTEDPLQSGMDTNIGGTKAGHPKSYFSPYKNPALKDGPQGEYLTERLAKEAVNYIDTISKEKPFFLYYATYAVHTPLQAKAELIEKYKQKQPTKAHNNPIYAAMIETMDQAVGNVMQAVERNGIAENTLIVFTSDNGGAYHISRQWPLRAGKGAFYEGGIREPMIVYMKGKYEGGITYEEPVSQLDFYPTFAELAGTKLSFKPDGLSLLPLLDKGKTDYLSNRTLYWHFPAYLESVNGDNEGRDPLFRSRPVSVIRQGDWKLIENFEDGVLELYNLKKDPSEKYNLSDKYPKMTKRLYKQLKKWQQETKAAIPTEKNPLYKTQTNTIR